MTALSERIKELRKREGLSQEELARRAGMSLNGFSLIERGKRNDPHYSTLCAIARGLDVTLVELLWNLDEPAGGPGQW